MNGSSYLMCAVELGNLVSVLTTKKMIGGGYDGGSLLEHYRSTSKGGSSDEALIPYKKVKYDIELKKELPYYIA